MNLNTSQQARKPPPEYSLIDPPKERTFSPVATLASTLIVLGLTFGTIALGGYSLYASNQKVKPAQNAKGGSVPETSTPPVSAETVEEELKETLGRVVSYYESGDSSADSSDVFTSDAAFWSYKEKAKGDEIGSKNALRSGLKLPAFRLDSFSLLSEEKAIADATVLLERTLPLKQWFDSDKNPPGGDRDLVTERFVRYGFEFVKQDGRWLVSRQTWLDKSPGRVREAADTTAEKIEIPEASTLFNDLRPSKEQLQGRYDSMCQSMNAGKFPTGECFEDYELLLYEDPKKRTRDQAKARLEKFHRKMEQVEFTASVAGVSQVDTVNALAVVTYRVNFRPAGAKNVYTATWRDLDTWNRSSSGGWYLLKTERTTRSALMNYHGY